MAKSPELDLIIDGLAHLIASDIFQPDQNHDTPAVTFDGFEPLSKGGDGFILNGAPNDIPVWPMDVSFGAFNIDADGPAWSFHRVKTLNPREWRGRLRIVVPKMYELSSARCSSQALMLSSVSALGVVGNELVDARNRQPAMRCTAPGDGQAFAARPFQKLIIRDDQWTKLISISHGMMLRRRYQWSVLLGEGYGPRARFITDPVGCREAFRLRDIPPGIKRRAALRHWVREHWRKSRELGGADKIWVREHLRGASAFRWNGLTCEIEPSQEDLERNKSDAGWPARTTRVVGGYSK